MKSATTSSAVQAQGAASRAAAATALFQVLEHGRSLSDALPAACRQQQLSARDQGLAQTICYGVLRHLPRYNAYVNALLEKPLRAKMKPLHYLLLVGIYQIVGLNTQTHAAVAATVEAAVALKLQRHKGLVNGVLRNFLRHQADIEQQASQSDSDDLAHPRWLQKLLIEAYGQQLATEVMQANNQQAPMWLRVNLARQTRAEYQLRLQQQGIDSVADEQVGSALRLTQAVAVQQLPGFATGDVSVQDVAAQACATLLQPQAGQRVLDCCAAPGGKTVHLLEHCLGELAVTALDVDERRLQRVAENLQRGGYQATLVTADAGATDSWWDGQPFQAILLDAPCSATGVIRRHPDIKWLRRADDIATLEATQRRLLDNLWPTLAIGGRMLYATCSILPGENSEQIAAFLARHQDARLVPIATPQGGLESALKGCWQRLPGTADGDGFFYAVMEKQA